MENQDKLENWIDCCHTIRVLHKAGIQNMQQLSTLSDQGILALRGIGPVIAGDLRKKIDEWMMIHKEKPI